MTLLICIEDFDCAWKTEINSMNINSVISLIIKDKWTLILDHYALL